MQKKKGVVLALEHDDGRVLDYLWTQRSSKFGNNTLDGLWVLDAGRFPPNEVLYR